MEPTAGAKNKGGVASSIVGSIVEKGFTTSTTKQKFTPSSSSFPKPTLLPFPVARHRSHGPHWAPLGSEMDVEDDNEDKDDTDFAPIAAFADPIQRKQRKDLDFSKWRELIPRDCSTVTQEKKMDDLVRAESGGGMGEREATENSGNKTISNSSLPNIGALSHENLHGVSHMNSIMDHLPKATKTMAIDSKALDSVADMEEVLPVQLSPEDDWTKNRTAGSNKFEDNESGCHSLSSEIDAENRARLQGMSFDEIAEAQAEIMGKMKSATLEKLKKRGLDKLRKRKSSMSDLDARQHPDIAHQESNKAPLLESANTSDTVSITPADSTCRGPDSGGLLSSAPPNSNAWNLWTNRVEMARGLRFSLDGTVMGNDSIQVPTLGNFPDSIQCNAENVTERDFLRTEGDPGGVGYTIKEAIALTRSMIPGQRALALQLLATVLDKALCNLHQNDYRGSTRNANNMVKFVDWQAVWAFALGPEPELVFSLRLAMDDNHISVVLACVKVIQCILSCDMNENFFNTLEKFTTPEESICTAPIFRNRPEVDVGFLGGGFWKYNTKPSNILSVCDENGQDENEGKQTIQDDIVVAGQDVAAGLVRMGILPRICYLLEMEPFAALEECLVSVLIGLARHSSTCASAIMECPRLVQTLVHRFIKNDTMEIYSSKIKSVILLKVLVQSDKKNCVDFIKRGFFQDTMWHLYKYVLSLDHWIKSGRENCKLTSALMVEQLRFWRVCIRYGYCISYFADFFPVMCLWLSPPTFEKLIESNVFDEFMSVTREAYLTLEALARRLPNIHSRVQRKEKIVEFDDDDVESWSWSHVVPMVGLAMKWLSLMNVLSVFNQQKGTTNLIVQDSSVSCFPWVISAVMHMLSSIIERTAPEDNNSLHGSDDRVPWLPEFVPKVGLEIVKNGVLNFSGISYMEHERLPNGGCSFVNDLCHLRHHNDYETSLSSISCLRGLVRLIVLVDKSIQIAKSKNCTSSCQGYESSREDKIVENGIVLSSQAELKSVLASFMSLVTSEWHDVQSIEIFSRGGPAPGIGFGWGASGGGFWSVTVMLGQMDARLVMELLEMFPIILGKNPLPVEDMTFTLQRINSSLAVCLVGGPRDRVVVEKALDVLLQPPVLKCLCFFIHHFLHVNEGMKTFGWDYTEEDYLSFSIILNSHFRNRWLSIKRKPSSDNKKNQSHKSFKKGDALDTIHEDLDTSNMSDLDDLHYSSLVIEWAHQRLPLPMHWFLSPISTIGDSGAVLDVAKSGLFLLLGLEAMSSFLGSELHCSPIQSVPLVWKLHALSMVLLVKMDVLEDEKNRDVYETLQELYGRHLDQSRFRNLKHEAHLLCETGVEHEIEFLKFQTDIHESYSTFVETLVEQFSAISYGDVMFGRQIALYLHRSVEIPIRLAAWNALSNAHILELLPPLNRCYAESAGYLEPLEENEGILEAYVKSWISGGLERAAMRGSISYTLVVHHLSSFIFQAKADDKLNLRRNKLAKSLLRDYSRKPQHERMLLEFIQYEPVTSRGPEWKEGSLLQTGEMERRFSLLLEACEGNSSLLAQVQKLKSAV